MLSVIGWKQMKLFDCWTKVNALKGKDAEQDFGWDGTWAAGSHARRLHKNPGLLSLGSDTGFFLSECFGSYFAVRIGEF
jgi:hypothetical protein